MLCTLLKISAFPTPRTCAPLCVCLGYAKPTDEGLKLGDYPELPWRSAQQNAPSGWWDNQDRRDKETPCVCGVLHVFVNNCLRSVCEVHSDINPLEFVATYT